LVGAGLCFYLREPRPNSRDRDGWVPPPGRDQPRGFEIGPEPRLPGCHVLPPAIRRPGEPTIRACSAVLVPMVRHSAQSGAAQCASDRHSSVMAFGPRPRPTGSSSSLHGPPRL